MLLVAYMSLVSAFYLPTSLLHPPLTLPIIMCTSVLVQYVHEISMNSGILSQALSDQWSKKPMYVVGGVTADTVQSLGLSPWGRRLDKHLIIQSSTYPMETHKHMFIRITAVNHRLHMCTHTHFFCCCVLFTCHLKVKLPSTPNSPLPSRPPFAVPL